MEMHRKNNDIQTAKRITTFFNALLFSFYWFLFHNRPVFEEYAIVGGAVTVTLYTLLLVSMGIIIKEEKNKEDLGNFLFCMAEKLVITDGVSFLRMY